VVERRTQTCKQKRCPTIRSRAVCQSAKGNLPASCTLDAPVLGATLRSLGIKCASVSRFFRRTSLPKVRDPDLETVERLSISDRST